MANWVEQHRKAFQKQSRPSVVDRLREWGPFWRVKLAAVVLYVSLGAFSLWWGSGELRGGGLQAFVVVEGGARDVPTLAVRNGSRKDWQQVRMELDGAYVYFADSVGAREVIRVRVDRFRSVNAIPRAQGLYAWELAALSPMPAATATGQGMRRLVVQTSAGRVSLSLEE